MAMADDSSSKTRVSLLVRNLSFSSSPEDVRTAFSAYGSVRDVYLPLDFHTRKPRGFGFVEFYDSKDAERCLDEMDGKELDGKLLEVTLAKKGRSEPDAMRRREYRSGGYDPRGRSPPRSRGGYDRLSYRRDRENGYHSPSPHGRRDYRYSRDDRRHRRSRSRSYSRRRSRSYSNRH